MLAAAFVVLRGYEPLGPGTTRAPQLRGLAGIVDPAMGSGGKPVLFPEMRPGGTYYAGFTVENSGRFDVTIEGTPAHDRSLLTLLHVSDVRTAPPSPATARRSEWTLVPLDRLRVPSGEERSLWVGFRLHACAAKFSEGTSMSTDVVRLRYSYLGVFRKTAPVEMPYAVTARCGGNLPASTR